MLFGVPEREVLEEAFTPENPVWKAVGNLLGWVSLRQAVPFYHRPSDVPWLCLPSIWYGSSYPSPHHHSRCGAGAILLFVLSVLDGGCARQKIAVFGRPF